MSKVPLGTSTAPFGATPSPVRGLFFCVRKSAMQDTYIGFIDVGFLRAEGAKALDRRAADVELNATAVVDWLVNLRETRNETFLRAYWYDGAFDPSHSRYHGQRRELDRIARTPGIQLRLGHITEYPSRIRNPILRALRNTASELGIVPEEFITEFNRNWTFYPERRQKALIH